MIHRLSPSLCQNYRKCGKQIYIGRILGIKNPNVFSTTEYGTAMHTTLEQIMKSKKESQLISKEDAKTIYREEFSKRSIFVNKWGEDSIQHLLEQGYIAISDFYDNYLEKINPEEVEYGFNIEREGHLPIRAVCDIIDIDGSIYDYKFGRSFTGSAKDDEYMLNMATYAYGRYLETGEVPKVKILKQCWRWVKQPNGKRKWYHKGFEVNEMNLTEDWFKYYLKIYDTVEKAIQAEIFLPAKDGEGLCFSCGYRGLHCDVIVKEKVQEDV